MTTQWSRFKKRSGFTIADLGGENAIEIYNGTGGFQGVGEGDSYSYDMTTADATLDAETMAPSAVSGIEDSGTFEGISQVAFIDSSVSQDLFHYGDEDNPPTRIKVLENEEIYELETVVVQGDGYKRLDMADL